jgi:glutamyl-tRNA reductase
MNIFCAGINHRLAPVSIREKLAVPELEIPSVLQHLRQIDGTAGAVVLSTCNRVEFYTATICPVRTLHYLRDWLGQRDSGAAPLYEFHTPASVRHLFRVSCGLDSMVLGETEVLGQVKKAYSLATDVGAPSRHLHRLFQHAFRVAKQVRTHTGITRGATSVGAVAVELAEKIFGDLRGRRVMILGAGETSERTARSLQSRGVQSVIVSNRTFARAAKLAAEIGGLAIHFEHWDRAFADVDILIGSTGAPHPVLTKEKLRPLLAQRPHRPLFVIDLAVPRDVTQDVNELDGVFLYDIDSLQEIARESMDIRRQEITRCETIIEAEVTDFVRWLHRPSGLFPQPLAAKLDDPQPEARS